MRKIVIGSAVIVGFLGLLAPAASAAPAPDRSGQLACFTGGTGSCTGDGSSYTLAKPAGTNSSAYAGVYLTNKSLSNRSFAEIGALGFDFNGDTAGGSPRFSIPIKGGGYVFVDAQSCNDTDSPDAVTGTVDPINDPTCVVSGYLADGTSFSYSSWSDFLAGQPGLVVGNGYAFVIYDWSTDDSTGGSVTVSNIALGNAKTR